MDYETLINTPESELDKMLAVKFYKKAVKNNFKSKEEGRNVFDNVDYISIIIPGDNTSKIDRPATDKDKQRFSIIWERYLNKESDLSNGLALELLPTLSPAQIENLKAYKIYTIEQLAGLQEGAILKINGARLMVQDANKFLEGDSYTKNLEKEVSELKEKLESLLEKVNEPINDNPVRGRRNGAGRKPSDSNREPRSVRKKVSSASNQDGQGIAVSPRLADSN